MNWHSPHFYGNINTAYVKTIKFWTLKSRPLTAKIIWSNQYLASPYIAPSNHHNRLIYAPSRHLFFSTVSNNRTAGKLGWCQFREKEEMTVRGPIQYRRAWWPERGKWALSWCEGSALHHECRCVWNKKVFKREHLQLKGSCIFKREPLSTPHTQTLPPTSKPPSPWLVLANHPNLTPIRPI